MNLFPDILIKSFHLSTMSETSDPKVDDSVNVDELDNSYNNKIVKFVTTDDHIFKFRYNTIRSWPKSNLTKAAIAYLKKQFDDLPLDENNCIVLDNDYNRMVKFFDSITFKDHDIPYTQSNYIIAALSNVNKCKNEDELKNMKEYIYNVLLEQNWKPRKSKEKFDEVLTLTLKLNPIKKQSYKLIESSDSSDFYDKIINNYRKQYSGLFENKILIGKSGNDLFIIKHIDIINGTSNTSYDDYYDEPDCKGNFKNEMFDEKFKILVIR